MHEVKIALSSSLAIMTNGYGRRLRSRPVWVFWVTHPVQCCIDTVLPLKMLGHLPKLMHHSEAPYTRVQDDVPPSGISRSAGAWKGRLYRFTHVLSGTAYPFRPCRTTKGRGPLGEDWLRVGAIIAEINMNGYGVARWLSASSARQRLSAY